MLTIAYITSRLEPRIRWFLDGLPLQLLRGQEPPNLIVIDRLANQRTSPLVHPSDWKGGLTIHAPKPSVWQGIGRLTSEDWFAAANARNTALCLAPDGWIAYVDDLSVPMPRWLDAVREAQAKNYVACGAYRKVKYLRVRAGEVELFVDHVGGRDARWEFGRDDRAVPCGGSFLYGCSVAAPVEALLRINGWPEEADGMGSEDYLTGQMLQRNHVDIRYDRRMLTLESEEDHFTEPALRRTDKGVSPQDKSHAIISRYEGMRRFPQPACSRWPGDRSLAALRQHVLAGGEFPVPIGPTHDWYDEQPISEMR